MICQVKYSMKALKLSFSMIKFLECSMTKHDVHPPSTHPKEVLRDGGGGQAVELIMWDPSFVVVFFPWDGLTEYKLLEAELLISHGRWVYILLML